MIATMGMACSQIPADDGVEMDDVVEIESEYYSNYPEEGGITMKISSYAEFEAEWKKVHEGMDPVPELPSINFDERDLILLMLETKPTGGFGINEVTVLTNADQLTVQYSEIQPGAQCFTTQALTRPFTFISIPKSDKEIKFLKGEPVIRDCTE